ncbi:hypothetical protein [Serratia proteamaculans]|uniref:hypothetical protein n=1 Tax=Serratia proteamaculans TaxID=28151 RepID=UPI0039AF13D6
MALIVCGCFFGVTQAAEPSSPADRDSINQQQKMLLEQAQQQREALQNNVMLPALSLLPIKAMQRRQNA